MNAWPIMTWTVGRITPGAANPTISWSRRIFLLVRRSGCGIKTHIVVSAILDAPLNYFRKANLDSWAPLSKLAAGLLNAQKAHLTNRPRVYSVLSD
jgi:hypothetical protein